MTLPRDPAGALWHLDRLAQVKAQAPYLHGLRGQAFKAQKRWQEARREFDLEPATTDSAWYRSERGHVLAHLGLWNAAHEDFAAGVRLNAAVSREFALVSLKLGKVEEYQETCRKLLKPDTPFMGMGFGQSPLRTALIGPGLAKVKDVDKLLATRTGGMGGPGFPGGYPGAYFNEKAAGLVRVGRDKEALNLYRQGALTGPLPALDLMFLALAQQRLGLAKEAQSSVAEGRARLKKSEEARRKLPPSQRIESWQDRLEEELLLAEATATVERRPQP